jgi:hypothetical protein
VVANLQRISGSKEVFFNTFSIHEGTVTTVQILDIGGVEVGKNSRMVRADGRVSDTDVIIRRPTDFHFTERQVDLFRVDYMSRPKHWHAAFFH